MAGLCWDLTPGCGSWPSTAVSPNPSWRGPGSPLTCLSMNQGCQSQTLSFSSAAWQCPGLRMVLWRLPGKGSYYSYLSELARGPLRSLVKCLQSENARKEFLPLIHAPDADGKGWGRGTGDGPTALVCIGITWGACKNVGEGAPPTSASEVWGGT